MTEWRVKKYLGYLGDLQKKLSSCRSWAIGAEGCPLLLPQGATSRQPTHLRQRTERGTAFPHFFSQLFFLIFWMENMFNIDNDIEMVSLFYYYYTMADWLMLFWFSLYFIFIKGFFNRCQCGRWRVFVYSYNRINILKMSNTYIYFPISL